MQRQDAGMERQKEGNKKMGALSDTFEFDGVANGAQIIFHFHFFNSLGNHPSSERKLKSL